MKLPPVLRWLLGVRNVAPQCPERVEPPSVWVPPPLRHVHPDDQARCIVSAWQDAGEAGGAIPRGEIFRVYQNEHCEMFGFHPVKFNALCTALGKICEKKRIWSEGHKVTAYVIPRQPRRGAQLSVLPSGNAESEIPFDLPIRSRAGTRHAQA